MVLQTFLSPFGGRLSDRVQPRWVVSTGMGFCVVGLVILAFLGFATPYWLIIVALCLLGIGYALFSGPNQSAIMGSVERKDVGPAGAMVGTMRVVGPGAERGAGHPGARRDRRAGTRSRPPDNPQFLTGLRISFIIMAAALRGERADLAGPRRRRAAPGPSEPVAPVTEA